MALANILEVYLREGEPSEIIRKLKENDVCLESFFNEVQILKAHHNSKIYFQELYKAVGESGFDHDGVVQSHETGFRLKIVYSYFNSEGLEQMDFILL